MRGQGGIGGGIWHPPPDSSQRVQPSIGAWDKWHRCTSACPLLQLCNPPRQALPCHFVSPACPQRCKQLALKQMVQKLGAEQCYLMSGEQQYL